MLSDFSPFKHFSRRLAPALALFFTALLMAQVPTAGVGNGQGTPARQVPLSGRQQQSGSVMMQQSAQPGGGAGNVNTINTVLQVQGAYLGSIPNPAASHGAVALTLDDAIQQGLRYNLGSVSADAALRQVRGQRLAALSALLPSFSASVSETGSKTDLQALGLSSNTIRLGGPGLGGFAFPTTVGPFHYYDAQTSLDYNVLDFVAVHNYRQAKDSEAAAQLNEQDARELVVLAVSGEYLRVLTTAALVDSQEAQVRYAKSSLDQAQAQYRAGTSSEVDLLRSQVQLQTEQERLASQRADLIKQKRTLERLIGSPLDIRLSLAERLTYSPQITLPLKEALNQGLEDRTDLRAAKAQLRAAEEALKAAHAERLPSVKVSGFFGVEGIDPNKGNGVFSGTAALSIPIWHGRRIDADAQQAQAAIEQRRAEYQDQRGKVELEIRNAYTDLKVVAEQVKVASSNRDLALQTLKQSQDRFAAGVTDSVEVVQSEEILEGAESGYIGSLYSYNLAKLSLARAMGNTAKKVPGLLKGQ